MYRNPFIHLFLYNRAVVGCCPAVFAARPYGMKKAPVPQMHLRTHELMPGSCLYSLGQEKTRKHLALACSLVHHNNIGKPSKSLIIPKPSN